MTRTHPDRTVPASQGAVRKYQIKLYRFDRIRRKRQFNKESYKQLKFENGMRNVLSDKKDDDQDTKR